MFCTSLRKRKEWATVPATLLSQKQAKWQEKKLETHDLAISLPQRGQDPEVVFQLLLLSAADMQPPQKSLPRVERLYQAGGKHTGIMFLLREQDSQESGSGAFMGLQAMYSTRQAGQALAHVSRLQSSGLEVPIIMLSSVSSLNQTIFQFHRQLVQSHAPTPIGDPATTLLPYCSNNPPIAEHIRHILSDLCHNVPELSQGTSTAAGKRTLMDWLPEPSAVTAEEIIGFWEQEYIAE